MTKPKQNLTVPHDSETTNAPSKTRVVTAPDHEQAERIAREVTSKHGRGIGFYPGRHRQENLARAYLDLAAQLAEAQAHIGEAPTTERIREAHSAMPEHALRQSANDHRAYKQGHDERCYICTLLAQLAERERALQKIAISPPADPEDLSEDYWYREAIHARTIAREALAATRSDSEERKNPCPRCGSTTWTWKSAKMSMKDPRCSDCADSEERGQ